VGVGRAIRPHHLCVFGLMLPQSVLPWVGVQALFVPCVTLACACACLCVLARLPVCPGRGRVVPPSDPSAPLATRWSPWLAQVSRPAWRCCYRLSLTCFAVCGVLPRKKFLPTSEFARRVWWLWAHGTLLFGDCAPGASYRPPWPLFVSCVGWPTGGGGGGSGSGGGGGGGGARGACQRLF
jgi:hypothetical protein